MNKTIKTILTGAAVFAAAALILTAVLVLSNGIPRSAMKKNILASAEYLCEGDMFAFEWESVAASRMDHYADSILLGIAWQTDGDHPLENVMRSAYYHDPLKEENENLLDAVRDDLPSNQEYMRYWHGSVALVRPLLTVMSVRDMYVFFAVLMVILIALLIIMLARRRALSPVIGLGAGLIMTAAWFVPESLEYTWCYLLALVFSILAVIRSTRKNMLPAAVFFMLAGMLTSYMDFLTTETLTLTIPLLIMLYLEKNGDGSAAGSGRDDSTKERKGLAASVRMVISAAAGWFAGYACMWALKWILAALVTHADMRSIVMEHVTERLVGDVSNLQIIADSYYGFSISRNITALLPFGLGNGGLFAGVIIIIACIYFGFVYRRKVFDRAKILAFSVVGLVPYLRYLVVYNHSYIHYFFTFRAQMATVLAIALILGELLGTGRKKQRKGCR
ncbi:MAG: hypothetical protein K6C95_00490 [Lachnospiraceae bacterium]|nr:hypothetical protein [Lachnospiraceae bacterium]